ncbi:hypothetical protein [Nocardia sp. NPDC057030]|uniref:hypothetical protein n=1 Tax=unclassified Nocardia TaxID=2637762 RepID=UPI00363FA134
MGVHGLRPDGLLMVASVVNSANQQGSGATLVCNKPTNTASGDAMIAWHGNDFGTYSELTAPAGWTLLTGLDRGTNLLHQKIWTRIAGASEGTTYTFNQGSGEDGVVIITTLRGVDTNTAHWLYAAPVWSANSTSRVAPTVVGPQPGGVLLCSTMVDMNNTAATFTPPSGMTEQADAQSNAWTAESVASLLNPPDPTGTKTFTVSSSNFFSTNGGIECSIYVPPATGPEQFFVMF